MFQKQVFRLSCIIMTLFPALWGIFSFLNNISDFNGTANNAVMPLLAMSNTDGNISQTWRALHDPWFSYAVLWGITFMETLAGILATIGILKMLLHFSGSYERFSTGKALSALGALCAISVWGLGFMVVAGDWFLAWQAKENSLDTQLGGMIYALPCMITLLVLMVHKESTKTPFN